MIGLSKDIQQNTEYVPGVQAYPYWLFELFLLQQAELALNALRPTSVRNHPYRSEHQQQAMKTDTHATQTT